MADWTPSLLTVSLATFDVTAFVLLAVLAGHASSALSELISGLNTVVGVLVFAYLWALVLVVMRWALGQVSFEDSSLGTLTLHAFGAGGLVGLAFLLGIVVVGTLPAVLTGNLEVLSFVLIAAIGGGIATVVGGIVGLLFGLVDLLAYRAAGRLLSPTDATTPDRQ